MWNRGKTLLALGMILFGMARPAELQEIVFSSGFEYSEAAPLDCVRVGYPCALADADPDALDRSHALLEELWHIRGSGSMQDAADHLAVQPDVHDIFFEDNVITFRVEGMMPVIFHDLPTVVYPAAEASQASKQGRQHLMAQSSASSGSATSPGIAQPKAVVGLDLNQDGSKDQRDLKSAWVWAPYQWLSDFDETTVMANILSGLPAYYATEHFVNPSEDDSTTAVAYWRLIGQREVFIVSTFAGTGHASGIAFWVSSGARLTENTPVDTGVSLEVFWHEFDAENHPGDVRFVLLPDFWRSLELWDMDHRLWMFINPGSAIGVSQIADLLQGGPVKLGHWAGKTAFLPQHVNALDEVLRFMELGVRAELATGMVRDQGLLPVPTGGGGMTDFWFNSGNGDVRLFELPSLDDGGSGHQLPNPFNLFPFLLGTPGDGTNDMLELTPVVDGLTADEMFQATIRFRVDGHDVPGIFGVDDMVLVDGHEFRWRRPSPLILDLGFPLGLGVIPIELILDLPEGGESRYTAFGTQESCLANVNVSMDMEDSFNGPIGFTIEEDGSLSFKLYSRDWILQNPDPLGVVTASFSTGPGATPLGNGAEFDLAGASLGYPFLQYYGAYLEGVESADCDTCGGIVEIYGYIEDVAISGRAEVIMPRSSPPPPGGVEIPVKMEVFFVAAFGSELDGGSYFVQCKTEYDP